MWLSVILLLLGFGSLYLGANWLVDGSVGLARRLGLGPLIIGLTVVAFATSTPELAVSTLASAEGSYDTSLGNIVGSNIANIGLILGLSALIRPLRVQLQTMRREIPIMLGVSLLLTALSLDGLLVMQEGILLLVLFVLTVLYIYREASREAKASSPSTLKESQRGARGGRSMVLIVPGAVLLLAGAALAVRSAIEIARSLGISEWVIGLSMVAIGTSLPELATNVAAASKGEADIAVGNIVGSNIFNILFILGIASVLFSMAVPAGFLLDYAVMLTFSFALLPIMRTGFRITRIEGGGLLVAYTFYILFIYGILS